MCSRESEDDERSWLLWWVVAAVMAVMGGSGSGGGSNVSCCMSVKMIGRDPAKGKKVRSAKLLLLALHRRNMAEITRSGGGGG